MKHLAGILCLMLCLCLLPAAAPAEDAAYHAYFGVQCTSSYVFRNAWNDNYGLNDAGHPGYFDRLTGWNGFDKEADGSVDYGGTFEDAVITGSGEYTVALTTGAMGFGLQGQLPEEEEAAGITTSFNLLFVSTDIPASLVAGEHLAITDVKVQIGAEGEWIDLPDAVDVSGQYVTLYAINTYNTQPGFEYTVPGADDTITFTFTVSGL